MRLTKKQLKQIINEELEGNIYETELEEALNLSTLQAAGSGVLKEMMNDSAGRERLAALLTAVPELATHICEVWGEKGIGGTLKKMCSGGIRLSGSPFYILAHIIKQMDDDEANTVIAAFEGKEPMKAIEKKPQKTSRPQKRAMYSPSNLQEAASEYVWGVKSPQRVANKYKISVLRQIIKEELERYKQKNNT